MESVGRTFPDRLKRRGVAVDRQRMPLLLAVSFAAVALAGCASGVATAPAAPPGTAAGAVTAPNLGLFSSIKAPSDREPVLKLTAQGVQVFRCESRDGALNWVFRQPDAQLLDAAGKPVGRHGANFSFEHIDGSRLVATVASYDEAPNAADLRWLLMTTKSYGAGTFEGVTHVQRINTRGGMPPARCDKSQVNQVLRVDFSAEFVYYRARAAGAG